MHTLEINKEKQCKGLSTILKRTSDFSEGSGAIIDTLLIRHSDRAYVDFAQCDEYSQIPCFIQGL